MSRHRHVVLLAIAAVLAGSLLGAPLVRQALGTITFTIPNTLGTQTGTVSVSLIDDNFTEIKNALSGLVAATTDLPLTRAYTGTQRWAKGANLASASTLALGTDGNYFVVTGTTTINGLSSLEAGTLIVLRFSGALTLTHSDPALVLLGATNAATAAGDMYWFVSDGGGNWREIWRRPIAGASTNNFFNGLGTWVSPAGASVVVAIKSATYAIATSSSSSTYADTGLTVNITPTSASNKVLVWMGLNGLNSSGTTGCGIRLVRGSTTLAQVTTYGAFVASAYTGASAFYLDSPATTSATTYKATFNSSANVAFCEVQGDLDGDATSFIVVAEVTP